MIAMPHLNAVSLNGSILTVDRKFHEGMLRYSDTLDDKVTSVNPALQIGMQIMDPIEVDVSGLPYAVLALDVLIGRPLPKSERARLSALFSQSQLVYGFGFDSHKIADELRVPYIAVVEYDLPTEIVFATRQVKNLLRKFVRCARATRTYYHTFLPALRRAQSVHCNGYPVFDVARKYNNNCVLYLDSRMSIAELASDADLRRRFELRRTRSFRLLYSGRYDRMKGTDDAVEAAAKCIQQGLNIECHFYGQGPQKDELLARVARSSTPERIQIHDAVPFPELLKISRTFDAFICCHIQNDPSCTYLETFGAGLPIIGYSNRMFKGILEASRGAGLSSSIGNIKDLSMNIAKLVTDPGTVERMSWLAVQFARDHNFELEFDRRTSAINSAIRSCNVE